MKLKERISWLMGTVQQSLFPHLDECLPVPLTEREKHLVKILELIEVEKFVPNSVSRQWLGRPIKEREAIALLCSACDRGVKKTAKGYTETWNGFKLQIDVNDCGLPLSAVLTSASVHDSQVAIPLMKLTSDKVDYCYDLMDAAYDAAQLWEQSRELGHVPIIDRNPRRKEVIPMAPHEAKRYNERTA